MSDLCRECGEPQWLCADNPACSGDFGEHNDDLVCAGCRRGNCAGACARTPDADPDTHEQEDRR